jgi:hypothetical protein
MQATWGWALLAATLLVFHVAVHADAHSRAYDDHSAELMTLEDWMATVLHASAAARPASYKQQHKDRACFKPISTCPYNPNLPTGR